VYIAIGDAARTRPAVAANPTFRAAGTDAARASEMLAGRAPAVTTRRQSVDSTAGACAVREACATHAQWLPAKGPMAVQYVRRLPAERVAASRITPRKSAAARHQTPVDVPQGEERRESTTSVPIPQNVFHGTATVDTEAGF
jgi:hypothetical protein